ncbi:MAG: hypothetical protein NUV49_00965 [Patescibacteria group bacterium]|nr:hypothetical protein [Patescibacteria group bacterium]
MADNVSEGKMSLCRWSSMDFACDLYCYYDCNGGITTHVASNRIKGDVPKLIRWKKENKDAWFAAHEAQSEFLKTAKHEPIGLPEEGETFNDSDLASFKERLRYLKELGYIFPESLFDITEEP